LRGKGERLEKKRKISAVISGVLCGIGCLGMVLLTLVYITTRKFLLEIYWYKTPNLIIQLATMPLWIIILSCFLATFLLI